MWGDKINLRRLTFSSLPVYGASGAHNRRISTRQQAVHAFTPRSLWASSCWLASSFADVNRESRSTSSCSKSRSSFASVSSRRRSSATGIAFPARHDSGSLKRNRGSPFCAPCSSTSIPAPDASLTSSAAVAGPLARFRVAAGMMAGIEGHETSVKEE